MDTHAYSVSQLDTLVNALDADVSSPAGIMDTMNTDFVDWLIQEVAKRGWSYRELSRRAGLSPSAVSKVASGERNAGFDFCMSIAGPLASTPEEVLRLAGLLPSLPGTDGDASMARTLEMMKYLRSEVREEIVAYVVWRYEREKES